MRVVPILALIVAIVWPHTAAAQSARPGADTVAIGGDVGFLAPENGASDDARTLEVATGHVDAFVEYYYTSRVSLRGMYGWASPAFESMPGGSLRRQHLNLNVIFNWELGRFRPFATVGGGTYFLSRRESGDVV